MTYKEKLEAELKRCKVQLEVGHEEGHFLSHKGINEEERLTARIETLNWVINTLDKEASYAGSNGSGG